MFEITAPKPYAETSSANFNGNIGSKRDCKFAENIRYLEALKALVRSGVHFQLHPCCSEFRGCSRQAILGKTSDSNL